MRSPDNQEPRRSEVLRNQQPWAEENPNAGAKEVLYVEEPEA